jgi:hypothetical protein
VSTELRLAQEIRKAIEFDLSGNGWRPRDGSPPRFFEDMWDGYLSDGSKVAGRELSLGEAKAIVGVDKHSVYWSVDDVVLKADHLPGAVDKDAVDSAATLLKQLARNERALWSPRDVMRLLDLPPEFLQLEGASSRLADASGVLRIQAKLNHEELIQFSSLLSVRPPTRLYEAENVLGLSLAREKGSVSGVAEVVRMRARLLSESAKGMPNALKNVQEAEKVLLKELGF